LRENDSPRRERSFGALENHGKTALQALVEAIHKLPNEFVLGFDFNRWKSDGYERSLLRQHCQGWLRDVWDHNHCNNPQKMSLQRNIL